MSTALLEHRSGPSGTDEPLPSPAVTGPTARPRRITVYGRFDCPWSYLAFRRVATLSTAGVEVDWRAVEPLGRDEGGHSESFDGLPGEMDRVAGSLLAGEMLPYDLAGFRPRTSATVAAYAESYAAGVAEPVRKVIFESFWMHGIDIGDARTLRTLLVDQLRGSASSSEAVRDWGYSVDVTGGPISTAAWQLVGGWAAQWRLHGKGVTPVVEVPGSPTVHGVEAVGWLGDQLSARDLVPELLADPVVEIPDARELPTLGWVTETGGRWLVRRQQVLAATRPDRA